MNKNDFSVSVAMAAYNGEHYIEAQIQSILSQLRPEDELVISLDPSSDRTEEIIRSFAGKDRRVRLIRGLGEDSFQILRMRSGIAKKIFCF